MTYVHTLCLSCTRKLLHFVYKTVQRGRGVVNREARHIKYFTKTQGDPIRRKKLPDRFFSKTFCALNSSGQKEFASIGGAHFCQLVVKPWRAKSFTEQSTRLYLHRTKTISHRQFPDNPRNGIEEIQSILTSSPRFIDVLAIIRTTEKLSS